MTDPDKIGQRRTRQREAIVRAIRSGDGPLTVPEIHVRARRSKRDLGIATVYRTVKLLLESGEIHQVVLPDGVSRYESADLDHHHHFRCRVCGTVYDLPGCMLMLGDRANLPQGFVVEDHELTLFGRCPDCANPSAKKNRANARARKRR